MRPRLILVPAALGAASVAPAQQFGFTHRMLPSGPDRSTSLALGDVDGDGDLDAFVGNSVAGSPPQNRLYLNDGTAAFTDATATNLPALGDVTHAVALGDVDGDGDLDAFVGNFQQQSRLYLNGGAGAFTDATAGNLPTSADDLFEVALGDVDGDGDLDVYVGTLAQDRLLQNVGGGAFADVTPTNLPALSDFTNAVALGDADGDGDLDAFVGNTGFGLSGQDRLHLNDGTGVFTDVTATNVPVVIDSTTGVALGDVDGDGDLDALAGNLAGPGQSVGQNRLYLNGGPGMFGDATATNLPTLPDNSSAVALRDLDGDGDLDAIAVNQALTITGVSGFLHPGHRLLLNEGSGVFAEASETNLPTGFDHTVAVALDDVDGDGDLDAFVGNLAPPQDRLYPNGGTGAFTDLAGTNLPPGAEPTRAVALGDVDGDGDGDPDALLAKTTASPFIPGLDLPRLYVNVGGGAFADATGTNLPGPSGVSPTSDLALGDVDGDGDLDAVLAKGWYCAGCPGDQNRLFLNNGAGVFTDVTATSLPALLGHTLAVALGDVDGDGDLDAYLGNLSLQYGVGGQDRVYRNGGTGTFSDVTAANVPALATFTQAVALGDVDGDGDLDALLGSSGQSRLYLNAGTGAFVDVTAASLPALSSDTRAVALGDVDEDGDLDALLGGSGYPAVSNRLYLNVGAGLFLDVTATDLPPRFDSASGLALGDVDGDGDLDAFMGNTGQDRIYVNLSRQLSWRGIPRAGKPLTLDLRGPANGSWLLAASVGTASIPVPPVGTLRLFLPTLFIVAGGSLDPLGRASLTFPVPANPTLIGGSLHWQAVVGPPLRFTNLEVTTVTSL